MTLIDYTLHLADNALTLGHRNSEWTGHGPILEQDIALSNISLDLIGQARYLYQYAAQLMGGSETEDSLAYLRDATAYKNNLLVEQDNGDWGKTVMRQFLFSAYQYPLYQEIFKGPDAHLAAIAEKSLKEVTYHLRWSSEWVVRLGQGTQESARRMNDAVTALWKYTGELIDETAMERSAHVDMHAVATHWQARIENIFNEAGIAIPLHTTMIHGGKEGRHTDHLERMLEEMQYMQRSFPGVEW